jgi:hypothetical protein
MTTERQYNLLIFVDVKTMVRHADRTLDHILYPVKQEPAVPWSDLQSGRGVRSRSLVGAEAG